MPEINSTLIAWQALVILAALSAMGYTFYSAVEKILSKKADKESIARDEETKLRHDKLLEESILRHEKANREHVAEVQRRTVELYQLNDARRTQTDNLQEDMHKSFAALTKTVTDNHAQLLGLIRRTHPNE